MRRAGLLAVVVLIYLFLLAPLIIVVAVSFDPTWVRKTTASSSTP